MWKIQFLSTYLVLFYTCRPWMSTPTCQAAVQEVTLDLICIPAIWQLKSRLWSSPTISFLGRLRRWSSSWVLSNGLFGWSCSYLGSQRQWWKISTTSRDARTRCTWERPRGGSWSPGWRRSANATRTSPDTWRCSTQTRAFRCTRLTPSKRRTGAAMWTTPGCMSPRSAPAFPPY